MRLVCNSNERLGGRRSSESAGGKVRQRSPYRKERRDAVHSQRRGLWDPRSQDPVSDAAVVSRARR